MHRSFHNRKIDVRLNTKGRRALESVGVDTEMFGVEKRVRIRTAEPAVPRYFMVVVRG